MPGGVDNASQDMLKNCRRMSLDELRENYDAVMARMSAENCPTPKTRKTTETSVRTLDDGTACSLPLIAWILLGVVGILDFGESRCWRLVSRWAHGIHPLLLVAALVYASNLGVVEAYDTEASCFFFAGAVSRSPRSPETVAWGIQ